MSNYLKRALQRLLVQRRHRIYEERIVRQAVPYGVWLEKLLEEEKTDILEWKEGLEKEKAGDGRETAEGEKAENRKVTADGEKTENGREKAGDFRGQRLLAAVLSWREFCDSACGKAERKVREDIWVVTPEPSCLTDEAAAEAERYFLEHPSCGIAYGDEDGYLKPDWSPDLLQSFFYFGNVFAVRRALAERAGRKILEAGGLAGGENDSVGGSAGGATDDAGSFGGREFNEPEDIEESLKKRLYAIVLNCIDEAKGAGHIEKVMFLGRKAGDLQGEWSEPGKNREALMEDGKACGKRDDHGKTGEVQGKFFGVDWGMEPEFDEIKRGHLYSDAEIPEEEEKQELVSVIIPSKDNPAVLSNCIHSLREQTAYRNFEIIVIDNGSNDKNKKKIERMRDQLREEYTFRYIYMPMTFNFSAMCNLGAKEAAGRYLLFLNDDMEIAREDWLSVMAAKAAKRNVGAVGAKLLYPDSDKIQHLGITNIHLGPAHKLQFSSDKKVYYHGINRCAVNVSAVTGACLMVRREVFEQIGGFDERFAVAFNDVELCFHLLRAGYRNVCCNQTFLYHHESLSRGFDAGEEKVARLHRERDLLYAAYPEMWNRDPYYSRRLVTDILDRGYEPACRFEEERMSERAEPVRLLEGLDPVWHNECLYMGLEFTGDENAWKTGKSGGGDYYIQGWSYAVNVDNSRYEKSLLLKQIRMQDWQDEQGENGERLWRIPYRECHRPDFQENLPYIDHPALCGVSVWVRRDALPEGEYLIGYLWEDTCSRQKLYGFSAETLRVE